MQLSSLINAFFAITALTLVWPQALTADDESSTLHIQTMKLDDIYVRDFDIARTPIVDLWDATRSAELTFRHRKKALQRSRELKPVKGDAGDRETRRRLNSNEDLAQY